MIIALPLSALGRRLGGVARLDELLLDDPGGVGLGPGVAGGPGQNSYRAGGSGGSKLRQSRKTSPLIRR